jgi:hypothetical protein
MITIVIMMKMMGDRKGGRDGKEENIQHRDF